MLCLNLQSADLFSFAIVIQVHNNRHICIYTDKYIYTCTRSQNHRISWDRRGTKVKSKFWTAKDFAKHNGQYRYSINEDWELKKIKKKNNKPNFLIYTTFIKFRFRSRSTCMWHKELHWDQTIFCWTCSPFLALTMASSTHSSLFDIFHSF